MRVASVLFAFLFAFGIVAGTASADKGIKSDEPVWHYDLSGARSTYPEQEPNDSCPGQQMSLGDVIDPARIDIAGDVDWYTFTTVDLLPFTVGTDASPSCDPDANDTYIYLYSSDCTTILAQDDDSGPGYYSLINWTPSYVGTYNVKVRHYGSSGTGCYKFFAQGTATGACCLAGGICEVLTQVECVARGGTYQGDNVPCSPNPCPQPPPNDTCAGAIEIADCTTGHLEGNTSAATNDYALGSPSCTGYSTNGKDVVYSVTVNADDVVHMVYTQLQADGAFYIVTDCSNVTGSCLIGADDTVTGQAETIDYTFLSGGTVFVILDAYTSNGGGNWTLDYTLTCPPPLEACCFPDGHCEMLTADACGQAGGTAQGVGSVCDPNPCIPEPGACCFPDGHCEMQISDVCVAMGGVFQGIGFLCDPNPCPQPPMACCFPDGTCQFVTEALCYEMGGAPQGYGSLCDPNPCPQPTGACCVGYDCSIVTAEECATMGGQYYGDGVPCDPSPCPAPATGACCLDIYGNCEVMTQEACDQAGGVYQGDDVPCDPNPCPITPTKSTTWGKIKGDYR